MTVAVLYKLLAIMLIVALGWVVGRLRWLGDEQAEPARVLSNAAFWPSTCLRRRCSFAPRRA